MRGSFVAGPDKARIVPKRGAYTAVQAVPATGQGERGVAVEEGREVPRKNGDRRVEFAPGNRVVVCWQLDKARHQKIIGIEIGAERRECGLEAAKRRYHGLAEGDVFDAAFCLERAPLHQGEGGAGTEQLGSLRQGVFEREIFETRQRIDGDGAVQRPERGNSLTGDIHQGLEFAPFFLKAGWNAGIGCE